jgi:hypothetical protein
MDPQTVATTVAAIVNHELDPIRIYLAKQPHERDPYLLPTYINETDELLHFLQHVVKGRLPHQTYRNHTQATILVLEQLVRCQQAWTGGSPQAASRSRTPRTRTSINDITAEALSFYSSLGFPDRLVAVALGTSRRTITRRRTELGMTKRILRHAVPQHDLEQVRPSTDVPQLALTCALIRPSLITFSLLPKSSTQLTPKAQAKGW